MIFIKNKHLPIYVFLLFAMLLFLAISCGVDMSKASNAELDFNYMEEYEFKDGTYVKGKVFEVYGEYAYEETTYTNYGIPTGKKVTAHYYLIPVLGEFEKDNVKYITVEISHKDTLAEAEKLMAQTDNYYNYGTEPDVWNEFEIVGEIIPLDAEIEGYLYEWLMYGDTTGTRADYEDLFYPYVIRHNSVEGQTTTLIVLIVLAAVCAIILTVFIVLHFVRKNESPVHYVSQPYENVPMGREFNPTEDSFDAYNSNNAPSPNGDNDEAEGEMGYANPPSQPVYQTTNSFEQDNDSSTGNNDDI